MKVRSAKGRNTFSRVLVGLTISLGLNALAVAAEPIEFDYVVVGSSAVGQGAIKTLEKNNEELKTVWISKEAGDPYNKVFLSDYLISNKSKDLKMKSVDPKINKKFGYKVVSIDSKNNTLEILGKQGKETIKYKKLLLGVGLENKDLELAAYTTKDYANIFTYYSIEDVHAIQKYMKTHKMQRAAVVGTGSNALECASALNKLGLNVSIIGRNKSIISKLLEPKESEYLKTLILQKYSNEVSFVTIPEKLKLKSEKKGDLRVATAIELPREKYIPVDIIIHAIGAKPNTNFLNNTEITLDEAGYIKTNEYLQTNSPDIYSAGDATLIYNKLWNEARPNVKWMDAFEQGECAAENMLKAESCKYEGVAPIIVSKPFDIAVAATDKDPAQSLTDKHILQDLAYLRVSLDKSYVLKSFASINGGMFQLMKIRSTLQKGETTSFDALLESRGWGGNLFMSLNKPKKSPANE